MTHNLLLLYEHHLAQELGITNRTEDQRRTKRSAAAVAQCAEAGDLLSTLISATRAATQRSVKFIRWVWQSPSDRLAEAANARRLLELYAT